jgi:hypothetical protein
VELVYRFATLEAYPTSLLATTSKPTVSQPVPLKKESNWVHPDTREDCIEQQEFKFCSESPSIEQVSDSTQVEPGMPQLGCIPDIRGSHP